MLEQSEAGDLVLVGQELEAEAAGVQVLCHVQTQCLVDGLAEPLRGGEDGVMEGGDGGEKTNVHGNLVNRKRPPMSQAIVLETQTLAQGLFHELVAPGLGKSSEGFG